MELAAYAALSVLALWIVVSGLDDLVILLAWLYGILRSRPSIIPPGDPRLDGPERPIAVFLPLWREHAVIRRMLERNLEGIRYGNYEVFAGAYPNDGPTLDVLRRCESRFPKVHLAVCPRDGPTSKADCLNAVWRAMHVWEEKHGRRFEVIVIHDAEDLIHPEEMRWFNHYAGAYGMVQVPVLPLPTPLHRVTHGVYCDEFAEYQTKDVPARQMLGGFIPSNGVGTGYARGALESLAASGVLFETCCLTEDYDTGYRLHRLGWRELFIPLHWRHGHPVATREYFPMDGALARRQRTRWVIGITLQSWERHGWGRNWREAYWFWRDRKGLVGNLVSVVANIVGTAAAVGWALGLQPPPATQLFAVTLVLQSAGLAARTCCVARIYGFGFALGVPIRMFWANWLNAGATVAALWEYAEARMKGAELPWNKTDHVYPEPDPDEVPALPAVSLRPLAVRKIGFELQKDQR
ncbi:MAG TPA: glycosyl transferase family protein [Bryobacteraceae bacterium]|nr:glycosyl transferase family protein [Bryobacteraceae bacterium]